MGEILEYAKAQTAQYGNYAEFKRSLDAVVERVEEGFVIIGYHLKVARDTDILRESGYKNMEEFAKAEYGLDKSTVSRFININDRFSVDGYSGMLQDRYRGMGRAKLQDMLALPDEITEELTPAYTREDIKDIRAEVDEEKKLSDIEVMLEGKNEIQEKLENNLQRALHQIGHDVPQLYAKLWRAYMENDSDGKICRDVMETVAPSGEGMLSTRLQGVGRLMLSFKGADTNISLINVRSEEKESYEWDALIAALDILMGMDTPEESWEYVYGEKYPEVAPVQQEERKKSKVITAPKEPEKKPETEKKTEEKETSMAAGVPDEIGPEQLPRGTGSGNTWKEPKKQERRPIEMPPADAQYSFPVGKRQMKDIKNGQRFLILRTHDPYRERNTIQLQEYDSGEATGEVAEVKITWLISDHGGLLPGYVAFQFEVLPPKEEQLPGQMSIEDMENEQENTDEAGKEDGIHSESQESDT